MRRWTEDAPVKRDPFWPLVWFSIPVYLWIAYEMIRVEVLL
jgi:hypothetical protein